MENIVDFKLKTQQTVEYLQNKKRILFLTTSYRWEHATDGQKAKSTLLAENLAEMIESQVEVIDVTKLHIYECEGNVSSEKGNNCGVKKALLEDAEKNPSGCHRCWASINNPTDELWKISKSLLESDAVVFFVSVRWGQTNAVYQKLIERLTWLENRHSTLKESNILSQIDAGIILVGQNWRGEEIIQVQQQVLSFFGFQVRPELCWNWQFSKDENEESNEQYIEGVQEFFKTFEIKKNV